jgi:agmatine deiminase
MLIESLESDIPPLTDFRWPAEWEQHVCTWAAWPVNAPTWPGIFDRIPEAFARFIATVAQFEPVRLLAGGEGVRESARPVLNRALDRIGSKYPVELVDIPVNDSWCRDYGPVFLNGRANSSQPGRSVIVDWSYNAWGNKYGPWDLDALAAGAISGKIGIPSVRPGLVLEGGAIEGNGAGTILTTESCLTHPNRNSGATRDSMEQALRWWMQGQHIVWVPGGGIIGDDTDGHIDQSARFVSPASVVVASPHDNDAPEAAALRANSKAIRTSTNASHESLRVIPLPNPEPKFHQQNRLPASYCNYMLANGAVIMPAFRDAADDNAMQILQDCFPDRAVVSVDALDLVWGLGAFHCLTQQQPMASEK